MKVAVCTQCLLLLRINVHCIVLYCVVKLNVVVFGKQNRVVHTQMYCTTELLTKWPLTVLFQCSTVFVTKIHFAPYD